MKKISVLFAFLALLFADLALAQGLAVVTSVTGSAQVQTGSASPRALRQGDEVRQGDTVATAARSSLVLKFDDGEVAALSQNSRMTITAYQYQPEARTGNVLLSLITGGMRAITGLIGHTQPERVAYRAAATTIGIRGTTVDIVTDGGDKVVVTVSEGVISISYAGKTATVAAGQGALAADNTITTGTAASIFSQLTPAMQDGIRNLDALISAINAAGAGEPRQGGDEGVGQATAGPTGGPTVTIGNSTGGGGSSSQH
jgi:hypothetical protein